MKVFQCKACNWCGKESDIVDNHCPGCSSDQLSEVDFTGLSSSVLTTNSDAETLREVQSEFHKRSPNQFN